MNTKKRILWSAGLSAAALITFEMGLNFAAFALFAAPFILIPGMERKSK